MEATIIKEVVDIFKNLSPQNQAYFMELIKVAQIAENSVKDSIAAPSHPSHKAGTESK